MSQIMQIAKEKSLGSFPLGDYSEANQESVFDYGLDAKDMIGLSCLFPDDFSYLADSKRGCMVIE